MPSVMSRSLVASLPLGMFFGASASSAAYPGSESTNVSFCCDHADLSILSTVLANPQMGSSVFSNTTVYPACQLLSLVPDVRNSTCASNSSSTRSLTVRDVIRDNPDAQRDISAGSPPGTSLLGTVIQPGTCQDLAQDAHGATFYSWTRWVAGGNPDGTISFCGSPLVALDANHTGWDMELRCMEESNSDGVLSVRASWHEDGEDDFCNVSHSLGEINTPIAPKDWKTDAGMPRWTCIDLPYGPESVPKYRLVLTNIGEAPCTTTPAPTPAPSTTSHHSSSSQRMSFPVLARGGPVAVAVLMSLATSTAISAV